MLSQLSYGAPTGQISARLRESNKALGLERTIKTLLGLHTRAWLRHEHARADLDPLGIVQVDIAVKGGQRGDNIHPVYQPIRAPHCELECLHAALHA